MMKKDLVLVSNRQTSYKVEITLPNIPSQRYAFGPSYPGERKGEEFIFTRNERIPADPTNGTIVSVDDKGKYWIQNDTRNANRRTTRSSVSKISNTFVNNEGVKGMEIRRLKSGDLITLGRAKSSGRSTFSVKERIIASSDSDNEGCNSLSLIFADSPLANNLILSEILSYLPVKDLKKARLVCKKWGKEASKALEKRGAVSFEFRHCNYLNPKNSTKVFRYLHEMRNMKMRNLKIHLDPPKQYRYWDSSPEKLPPSLTEKMLSDLQKLLKSSHNFSSLVLLADIREESDFPFFATIFHELGGKLVKLALNGSVNFFPDVLPPFPQLKNLKKFYHYDVSLGAYYNKVKMVSLLVPLFPKGLETFGCWENMAEPYLQAFLTQDKLNLKGIAITGHGNHGMSKETLPLLLHLQTPLTSLEINCFSDSEEGARLLQRLLSKHSQSLQTLSIMVSKVAEFKFPPFPSLEKFSLSYYEVEGVSWETDLDYQDHFPSLRVLKISPRYRWSNDDPPFNAFFPAKRDLRCESVREVFIPVLSCYNSPLSEADPFQPRMDQIMKMFPNAVKFNFFY